MGDLQGPEPSMRCERVLMDCFLVDSVMIPRGLRRLLVRLELHEQSGELDSPSQLDQCHRSHKTLRYSCFSKRQNNDFAINKCKVNLDWLSWSNGRPSEDMEKRVEGRRDNRDR